MEKLCACRQMGNGFTEPSWRCPIHGAHLIENGPLPALRESPTDRLARGNVEGVTIEQQISFLRQRSDELAQNIKDGDERIRASQQQIDALQQRIAKVEQERLELIGQAVRDAIRRGDIA